VVLVRAMLRDHGAWCRLEADGHLFVHVGRDQYLHVGSDRPCERAVARTHQLGLFAEAIEASPLDPALDEPAERRPADHAFWAELAGLVATRGAVLLQELFVEYASRWYRLTPATDLGTVRAGMRPRARLLAWPDLSPDVEGILARLPDDLFELVWEDADGRLHGQ
jgi:small subunit ribosomal protein S1